MSERIKCAATRHGNHIIAGPYHGACLKIAGEAGFKKADIMTGQGFLTTKMRYVLRKEALMIAEREGQITKKHRPFDILLSEDMQIDGKFLE